MTKKEYIQRAKNLILNRVRFHAPILFDDEIDERVLENGGIDKNLPIFKFEKVLDKKLIKAFALAKKEEKFNLVVASEVEGKKCKVLQNLPNTVLLGRYSSKRLLEMVNKLNINYSSSTNFNLEFKDKFFCVNGVRFNPSFQDFLLVQEAVFEDVFVKYNEFVLNGENIFVKFLNKASEEKKLTIELNIPLKKGYYYFKKMDKAYLIENLVTKEKLFFNFLCSGAKFSFSNVDGLENSVFCCVNLKLNITLKPKQMKFVFFNFGSSKFSIKTLSEAEKFVKLSQKKTREVFDVQVKTKNPKFDFFFNRTLPQKIWVNWLNGTFDRGLEEKYLTYRRLFVRGKEKISFVKFSEIGVREIGVFNGEYYKKILLVRGNEKFLKVGKTYFYNINDITSRTLSSKEPVLLSFGEE